MLDDNSRAFTVSVPEVRKYRFTQRLPNVFAFGGWIVACYALFGPAERPDWPGMAVAGTFLVFVVAASIYGSRKQKNLVAVINSRFAEVFTAKTGFEYPSQHRHSRSQTHDRRPQGRWIGRSGVAVVLAENRADMADQR